MKSKLIKIVAAVAAVVLVGVWLLMPSPLHRAANNGNIEAVKKHLADGADVDAKSWELFAGFTPLYLAAGEGHKEIVELLIAEGADVHAKDKWGFTPLHEAAVNGQKEVAELLIAKGADVNVKIVSGPNQGSTPLDAANGTNHPKIADLIRKHGGKTGEELK